MLRAHQPLLTNKKKLADRPPFGRLGRLDLTAGEAEGRAWRAVRQRQTLRYRRAVVDSRKKTMSHRSVPVDY
jgi:hypothetical protein